MPETVSESKQENYWWYARFKFNWDGHSKTLDFSKNLIVAHQLINPVLQQYNEQISLWRFHRRAANDEAGHQFSFIFYASPATAQAVIHYIESHPLTRKLIEQRILEAFKPDKTEHPQRPLVEDTSDKSWSLHLQRSWPYYIMGISVMWLDLVNRNSDPNLLASMATINEQMEYYKTVNNAITQVWKIEGEHAFYHHINAIFGYEPMEIRF